MCRKVYVLYCETASIWFRGIKGDKFTYTCDRRLAKEFDTKEEAEACWRKFPPVWIDNFHVMDKGHSIMLHDMDTSPDGGAA